MNLQEQPLSVIVTSRVSILLITITFTIVQQPSTVDKEPIQVPVHNMVGIEITDFLVDKEGLESKVHVYVDLYLKASKVHANSDIVFIDGSKQRFKVKIVLVGNEINNSHKVSSEVNYVLFDIYSICYVEGYDVLSIRERTLYYN